MPSVFFLHSAKKISLFNLFILVGTYNIWYVMLKFHVFLSLFTIFRQLIQFSAIFCIESNLNCKSFEYLKTNSRKLIFMLLNSHCGHNHETNQNFEHILPETRPAWRALVVLKFYKKKIMTENYEIWRHVIISYVEAVEKDEKVPRKLSHTLFTAQNISREVSYLLRVIR